MDSRFCDFIDYKGTYRETASLKLKILLNHEQELDNNWAFFVLGKTNGISKSHPSLN